ncbi:hypothetical protein EVAR_100802_1 [Eumeta japonica]|uniref:Mariner Mos1 transposase n=1 Tax=Eumeta variegata TaxID=151549 RepID=A0A4C1ZZE7_EUMVA|nr:hypothetical protein EVAR_100802_1 [Eumeta japonica]
MQGRHVTYREIKVSLGIKVYEKIRKNNRQLRIILHHIVMMKNASHHTSADITRVLEGQKIELTGHPPYSPYSPYWAPNGFYLLPNVKNKLRAQRFSSCE